MNRAQVTVCWRLGGPVLMAKDEVKVRKRVCFFLGVDDKTIPKITKSDFFLIDDELRDRNRLEGTRRYTNAETFSSDVDWTPPSTW